MKNKEQFSQEKTNDKKNLTVQFDKEIYEELQDIAKDTGMSLSSMVRTLIYSKLDEVRKTGNPRKFYD